MRKYAAAIMFVAAFLLSSCSLDEIIYDRSSGIKDSEIRWEEEEIILDAPSAEMEISDTKDGALKVYVTSSGKKFHTGDCSSLARSKIEKSYDEAVKEGYTACNVCRPVEYN